MEKAFFKKIENKNYKENFSIHNPKTIGLRNFS